MRDEADAPVDSLPDLLRTLAPEAREGEFVVATVCEDRAAALPAEALVREREGVTVVLTREDADRLSVDYDFVAAWITLTVHSSLDAVGLTAAFAAALAYERISCNVLAGFHHDHLLVPVERRDDALDVLRALSAAAGREAE